MDALGLIKRQACESDGEIESGDHPDRHGFTVGERSISSNRLDGVSDGMAKIEQGAGAAGFKFILGHDGRLDRGIPGNEFREIRVP